MKYLDEFLTGAFLLVGAYIVITNGDGIGQTIRTVGGGYRDTVKTLQGRGTGSGGTGFLNTSISDLAGNFGVNV